VVGAKFAVEPDPHRAALLIRRHIEDKRRALGLPALSSEEIGDTGPAVLAASLAGDSGS